MKRKIIVLKNYYNQITNKNNNENHQNNCNDVIQNNSEHSSLNSIEEIYNEAINVSNISDGQHITLINVDEDNNHLLSTPELKNINIIQKY